MSNGNEDGESLKAAALCRGRQRTTLMLCRSIAVGVISTLDAERSLGILKQNFVLLSCRHENAF